MKYFKLKLLVKCAMYASLLVFVKMGFSQTQFSPGPQITTFTANMVRGYHFTSPVSFNICQLYVPNTINSNMWHVEVVKFTNGAPPAYPGVTNNFISLFYADSVLGTTPISCNIPVSAGDIIGIYGSRSGTTGIQMTNSYDSPNFVTSIMGNNVTLSRSGMQFPLNNQQMHDIWSEVAANTSRIFGFYGCCPQPPNPIGPITGPSTACIGDTLTFSVPNDTLAVSYHWSVPVGDTIVTNNDSVIQMVVGPNSTGGQVCYYYTDTCMASNDTCFSYTINQPSVPNQPSGVQNICLNDTATFSIPAVTGAVGYNWLITNGGIVTSNVDSTAVNVQFLTTGVTDVCVQVIDSCAASDTVCVQVNVSTGTTPSNAGLDQYICDSETPTLAANNPTNGTGHWEIISTPINGAGTFSSLTSNTATYSGGGAGTHTLAWVIDNGGCPSSTDQVEIHIAGTPSANFLYNNQCVGTAFSFNDISAPNGTSISSWSWDLTGDGNPNTLNQHTTYTYNTAGLKVVTLIVTSLGCSDTVSHVVEVYPNPEINALGLNACDKDAVQFTSTTSILYGSVDSVGYDYGDGSFEWTNGAANHIYPSAGMYSTTITAVSNHGCQNVDVANVQVYHNPVADFSYLNACQYKEVSFTNLSTINAANITQYGWTLGDGTTSSALNPTHVYNTNGNQLVNLFVQTNQGCVDDTSINVEVFPSPVSEFNFSNKICEGQQTTLTQVSSINYGQNIQYDWVVMDSFNFSGESINYTFSGVGFYPVKLTTISDHGCKDEMEKMVPVFAVPMADFQFENGCERDELIFHNLSTSADPIATYVWNFNDSTTGSTDQDPKHDFVHFGTYQIVLDVTTFKGCSDQMVKSIEIFENPEIKFELYSDSGCSPLTVGYNDQTVMLSGDAFNFTWWAGQGEFEPEETITVYNYTGDDLSLPVSAKYVSEKGCRSEIYFDSLITLLPQPDAAFTYAPELVTTTNPLVQFSDESRDANYWGWNFGDGTTEKERNPQKLFEDAGEYNVTFWTRNVFGCVDTAFAKVIVRPGNRLYVPNSFSPNQDNINDLFQIYGLETASEIKMRVFDRWGKLVWNGDLLNGAWDGIGVDGKLVSNGVYAFMVRYIIDGDIYEYSSTITVIGVGQ